MDPLLYSAARSGEISFLETLTVEEKTSYFSQVTPMNNSLLHVAANFEQAEFFKKACLKCRPSLIWQQNSKRETPLHIAARVGCLEIVRFLIQQELSYADDEARRHSLIRKKNKHGDTALHCGVRSARGDVVFSLLEIDPELSSFCNYADESPLYLAVSSRYRAESIINFIRCSSPSFSHRGPRGLTALHEAVCYNASQVVEELVQKRPEMMKEADDILRRTPFHFAAFYGAGEAVKILLKYDVDSSAAYLLDRDGNSALHIAATEGHLKTMKILLQRCPDIFELANKKGQTALHVAVLNGKVEVVEYVLGNSQLDGMLNEPDEDGNTPLHLAVRFDSDEIIELLATDLRVDIKAKNKEFKSARHIFFQKEDQDCSTRSKIRSLLSGRCLAEYSQYYCRDVRKKMMNRKSELKPLRPGKKEHSEKFPDIYLIVATLVTTVSFSAAFTVPGGYTEKGKPVFVDNSFFNLFLVFNILSFISSISAIFFQTLAANNERMRHRYRPLHENMLFIGVLALAVAFACGVHVTLDNPQRVFVFIVFVIYWGGGAIAWRELVFKN